MSKGLGGRLLAVALAGLTLFLEKPKTACATTFTWTGGNFTPGVTAPSPLTSPDVLQINAGGTKTFDGVSFDNQSLVLWNADNLALANGASITNEGRWEANDGTLIYTIGARPTFTNSGQFVKTGTIGITTRISDLAFINSGTIEAQVGTITFSGGHATFNSGTRFTGAGSSLITANAAFNGSISSENLVLQTGTYTGSSVLLNGTTNFSGGTMIGTWEVPAAQMLTVKNPFLGAGVLTNKGTIQLGTNALVRMQNNSAIDNQGLLSFPNGGSVFNDTSGVVATLTNSGTVMLPAGQTALIDPTNFVNNGGTFQADGQLSLAAQNLTFNDGTVFSGNGVNAVNSNATFNGAFSSTNLALRSGKFTGNGAISSGVVQFSSTLAGSWDTGTAVWNTNSSDKILDGATLTNNSTINLSGRLIVKNGATLTNHGLVDLQPGVLIQNFGGATSTWDNRGTIQVEPGPQATISSLNFVNNGGTINVGANASVSISGTFNAGTRFTGAGTAKVAGTFNSTIEGSNLLFDGGGFTGNNAVLSGRASFASGIFLGNWTLAPGAVLEEVSGLSGTDRRIGGTIDNQGTLIWNFRDSLIVSSNGQLLNDGTIDLRGDGSIIFAGFTPGSFINRGLLLKSASTGISSIGENLGFDNLGVIEVDTGTLHLPNNFTNHGILRGAGEFQVDTLTNAGHVSPGNSPGTLKLTANFIAAASGSFDVDLENMLSHDLLVVNGNSTLGGTLALSCFGNCNYAIGDQIVILDATGQLNGTFANVTQSGFATGNFDVIYDAAGARVLLRVTEPVTPAPVPEPGAMGVVMLAAGALARRGRGRRLA